MQGWACMGPAAYRFVSYSLLRGAGCYALMALLRSGHTAAPPGPGAGGERSPRSIIGCYSSPKARAYLKLFFM